MFSSTPVKNGIKKSFIFIIKASSFVTKLDTKENQTVAGGKLVKAINLIGELTPSILRWNKHCVEDANLSPVQ